MINERDCYFFVKRKKKTLCNTRIHLGNLVKGSMTSCIDEKEREAEKETQGRGTLKEIKPGG